MAHTPNAVLGLEALSQRISQIYVRPLHLRLVFDHDRGRSKFSAVNLDMERHTRIWPELHAISIYVNHAGYHSHISSQDCASSSSVVVNALQSTFFSDDQGIASI